MITKVNNATKICDKLHKKQHDSTISKRQDKADAVRSNVIEVVQNVQSKN